MPIVCIERPNRTRKRTWKPNDLTRIVKLICKEHGQEVTERACQAGFCGETRCERIANEVLSAVAGAAAGFAILALLEGLLEIRIISWVIRRTPAGKALQALLSALRLNVGNVQAKQFQLEQTEVALRVFIRTEGRVWAGIEPPL